GLHSFPARRSPDLRASASSRDAQRSRRRSQKRSVGRACVMSKICSAPASEMTMSRFACRKASLSGSSVKTLSSPRTPWGRPILPMRNRLDGTARSSDKNERGALLCNAPRDEPRCASLLLDDLEDRSLSELGRGCIENGANGVGGAPLFANHFSEVLFGDPQLDDRRLFAFDLVDLDVIRTIDQRPCNVLDELLHIPRLPYPLNG